MKKIYLITMALLAGGAAVSQTLVWSDEFNGLKLDTTKWKYETGTGVNGDWGTGQLDAATSRPENVSIQFGIAGADGGALAITTRKETYTISGARRNYTSGRINTEGLASWGPGHRIVARVWARDVRYQGQGFAFWMMPQEIPPGYTSLMWPQGGEIDIMEFVGSIPTANLGSVHYAPAWNNNEWSASNHLHQGGYYSYAAQQVPLPSPQWIYVDLGSVTTINRVVLNWEAAYGKSYRIQVSNDAANWTDIYSTTTGDGGTDDISLSGTGRYVRMYATERGTQWGYSLYELQVFKAGGKSNLAVRKPAFASSKESTTLGPEKAVDGQITSRWASGSVEAPAGSWPASPTDPSVGSYGFHTYGIDWFNDRMEFHVDGIVYHIHYFNDGAAFAADGSNQSGVSVINGKRVLKSEFSNHYPEWHPFEHKFYAILSAGVGGQGTYGGAIVPEAEFPCATFVDWVRVYRLDPAATTSRKVQSSPGDMEPGINRATGYPNPAGSVFHLPSAENGASVQVMDMNGKVIATTTVRNHSINVSALKAGVYILTIRNRKNLLQAKMYKGG